MADSQQREYSFEMKDFQFVAKLAYQQTGIVLNESKFDMVYGRLVRRVRHHSMPDFKTYLAYIQSPEGKEELIQAVNALTTNLTHFFREGHHFDHFEGFLKSRAESGNRRLRLWSSACSSGMEPYSMAMVLRTAIPEIDRWDAKILATDIDTKMVSFGKEGVYKNADLEKIEARYRKYILPAAQEEHSLMHESLKSLIAFKSLNLVKPWPMKGKFDAVFCRNVVIYFDNETKTSIFNRIADLLVPDGFLYVGHSESIRETDRFESVGRTVYRKVK